MNDKMIMENYLLVLKSTVEVYVHGTLESSNEDVRTILKTCLNDTINKQKETYTLMQQNGWYKVCNVENNVIQKTLNKIENS